MSRFPQGRRESRKRHGLVGVGKTLMRTEQHQQISHGCRVDAGDGLNQLTALIQIRVIVMRASMA
ncbi:MAG: hypothetical protein PHR16_04620 [Methylovulum sp.]|nr:hypothetical protein [Methylovulum sp.]